MIKGVNKKVVEINNPNSLYFEKAVLYVKPNISDASSKFLSIEAQNYLKTILPGDKRLRQINSLKYILLAAVIVAAIGIACLFILK